MKAKGIEPSPKVVASAFNSYFKSDIAKPHTVRKWLLGQSKPRSEVLVLMANWLKVDPKELISTLEEKGSPENNISFQFDFTDQEVISKYLAMTVKKITVRLLIDAIADRK